MKILCASLWSNSWIPYWTKFIEDRGHEVKWVIDSKCTYEKSKDLVDWCDAILCHWAVGWSIMFSKMGVDKPVYVIHRSFEVFEDTKAIGKVQDNKWDNITELFMLNESHFPLFNTKVKNVQPIFVKNGIDLSYWKLIKRKKENHNVAWIANINHKKGEMLAIHAISMIQKIDNLVRLQHLGNIDSIRIHMYMQNIAPYLKSSWYSYGWVSAHDAVKRFLADKRYILCSSLVEGHPLSILEGMATGCQPLIHRYPGVQHQFPEKWIWNTFDDLLSLYQEDYKPEEYRQYIIDNYDYRKTYEPILKVIEDGV